MQSVRDIHQVEAIVVTVDHFVASQSTLGEEKNRNDEEFNHRQLLVQCEWRMVIRVELEKRY
jgi:hypothetical protein